jgi:hypothetical protein
VYLPRTCPGTSGGDVVDAEVRSAADRTLREARDFIAEDFRASPTADSQQRLPLHLVGCVLRVPSAHRIEGRESSLSSAVLARRPSIADPPCSGPSTGPAAPHLTPSARRRAPQPELWKPETQDLAEALTKRVLTSAQPTFAFIEPRPTLISSYRAWTAAALMGRSHWPASAA